MQVVGADESKVSCPKCGFVFLATDTAVSSKFRCRECLHGDWRKSPLLFCLKKLTGFCVTCGVSPFHDDLSCNQFAEIMRAPKCRFCKTPLKVAGKSCDDCKEKLQVRWKKTKEFFVYCSISKRFLVLESVKIAVMSAQALMERNLVSKIA